jgi:putative nucleotidyltransferase with HDIG domain
LTYEGSSNPAKNGNRLFRSRYFWYVAVTALLSGVFSHTPQLAAFFHLSTYNNWDLTYHVSLFRLLFTVSVAIAAWQFGRRGGLIVCILFTPVILSLVITRIQIPNSWIDIGLLAIGFSFSLLIGKIGNMKRLLEKTCRELSQQSERLQLEVSERKKTQEELTQSLDRLQRALQSSINATAKMVELRDPYTATHQQKVARLAAAIAEEMGLSQTQVKYIEMAAIVHDIGKIYIPAEILSRTGKLTELEYEMMKTHVQGSYDILKTIDFPWPIARIVYQHHERMDGSGYPDGLKGEEILLEARIIALADTVEAMSAHRPYRPALGIEAALEEITRNKGRLYDSRVVKACVFLFQEKNFRFESTQLDLVPV